LGVGSAGPTGEIADVPTGPLQRAVPPPQRADVDERQAWAVLASVNGLGPVGFGGLMRTYGSGIEILAAAVRVSAAELTRAATSDGRMPFDDRVAALIADAARDPAKVIREIEAAGVEVLTLDDDAYPARLRAIEMPPHVLFIRGDSSALSNAHSVAVVGTRRATEVGRLTAARIGAALARAGATVVSGLAVGIDGAAQAAVTAEEGITIAVLGSGHERLYPRAHANLARSIIRTGGAIVSEMAPSANPTTGTFPRRNRLISGLSDATVVVEAGERSGALLTAGWALEQGRACFFVPGSIDATRSAGCLKWLREYPGEARIVAGIAELIEDLGLLDDRRDQATGRVQRPTLEAELIELGATARYIAATLVEGVGTVDELIAATGHPVATVLGALTLLELRGLATSAYGRYRPAGRLAGTRPKRAPRVARNR
jgi:DNA processing protein